MEQPQFQLRPAQDTNFEAIQDIYGHYVLHGLASFEEPPPSADELRQRWQAIKDQGLPYIVAVDGPDQTILGYAYVSPYRSRPAYRHSVENSVYVAPHAQRRGVGRAMLLRLINDCEHLGWVRQMIAIIGDNANLASKSLHAELGFRDVGVFQSVGFKHGGWVDTMLMQRAIGAGNDTSPK